MRQALALIRTAIFAPLFISLWTWYIPRWTAGTRVFEDPRPAGFFIIALGAALALPAIVLFAWRGLGTPALFDPPRRLVVSGPYRFMRNPMYTGMALVLLGEAIAFPALTGPMLVILAVFIALFTAMVMTYEEPALREKFGGDYVEYCRNVRRWLPRLRPFDNERGAP
jgi:protein-S-isoprenylcysteine O-methyltransferase Ste14